MLTLEDHGYDDVFQGTFESCGDCDPHVLMLDGSPIGLVLVNYDKEARAALEEAGIKEVKS